MQKAYKRVIMAANGPRKRFEAHGLFDSMAEVEKLVGLHSGGLLHPGRISGRSRCDAQTLETCTCISRKNKEVFQGSEIVCIVKHFDNRAIYFLHRSACEFLEAHQAARSFLQNDNIMLAPKSSSYRNALQSVSILIIHGMLERLSSCLALAKRGSNDPDAVQKEALQTLILWNRFEYNFGYLLWFSFDRNEGYPYRSAVFAVYEEIAMFLTKADMLIKLIESSIQELDAIFPKLSSLPIPGLNKEPRSNFPDLGIELRRSLELFLAMASGTTLLDIQSSARTACVSWCLSSRFVFRRLNSNEWLGFLVERMTNGARLSECIGTILENGLLPLSSLRSQSSWSHQNHFLTSWRVSRCRASSV